MWDWEAASQHRSQVADASLVKTCPSGGGAGLWKGRDKRMACSRQMSCYKGASFQYTQIKRWV